MSAARRWRPPAASPRTFVRGSNRDFTRAWRNPIEKNGDRLRGTLETAAEGHKLRWRSPKSDTVFEIEPTGLAGVAFTAPEDRPETKTAVVARLRNGDTLGGTLIKFDAQNLVLDSAPPDGDDRGVDQSGGGRSRWRHRCGGEREKGGGNNCERKGFHQDS